MPPDVQQHRTIESRNERQRRTAGPSTRTNLAFKTTFLSDNQPTGLFQKKCRPIVAVAAVVALRSKDYNLLPKLTPKGP